MAKQQEAPRGKPKGKRKTGSTFLWTLLGLVILTGAVVAALFYMNRGRIQSDARLRVIKDFVARVDHTVGVGTSKLKHTLEPGPQTAAVAPMQPAPEAPPPEAPAGARTYRVKAGETLWHIAAQSHLVASPWQWRTILVQNRNKIDWAFINENEQHWKVLIDKGAEFTVHRNGQPTVHPTHERKFTVQLASMDERQVKRAEYVVRRLMGDGYYAYLYRVQRKGQTWYRVRSGLYDSEAHAKAVGEEIRQHYAKAGLFPTEAWVVPASAAERRGAQMVFGAELVNPWVVQLQDRDTHAEAVKDLHHVRDVGDFAYIWQTQNPLSKRWEYHVRIGFYGGKDGAQKAIDAHHGDVWKGAQPVQVDKFEESLPGQPMYLAGLRS